MNIRWTKVEERNPDNSGQAYDGSPCTPFVPCLVWACFPGKIHGGTAHMLRWDSKNARWLMDEMAINIYLQDPYEITHFCDERIPYPGSPECNADYQRGFDDSSDLCAQQYDPNY